jgi:hypothetical protein
LDAAAALQELITSTGPLGAFVWWIVSRVRGLLDSEFQKLHQEIAAVKADVADLRKRDDDLSRRIGLLEIKADTGSTPTLQPGAA